MPGVSPGVVVPGVVSGDPPGVAVPGVVPGVSPGVAVPGVVPGVAPGVAVPGVVPGVTVNVHVPVTVSSAVPTVTLGLSHDVKCHVPWFAASSTSVWSVGLATTSPVCLSLTTAGAVMLLGNSLPSVPLI